MPAPKTAASTAARPVATDAAGDPVARFEEAMQELETTVQKLERGELRLEESLALFERGMALTQQCRQALDTAELKIKTLVDGQFQDEPRA